MMMNYLSDYRSSMNDNNNKKKKKTTNPPAAPATVVSKFTRALGRLDAHASLARPSSSSNAESATLKIQLGFTPKNVQHPQGPLLPKINYVEVRSAASSSSAKQDGAHPSSQSNDSNNQDQQQQQQMEIERVFSLSGTRAHLAHKALYQHGGLSLPVAHAVAATASEVVLCFSEDREQPGFVFKKNTAGDDDAGMLSNDFVHKILLPSLAKQQQKRNHKKNDNDDDDNDAATSSPSLNACPDAADHDGVAAQLDQDTLFFTPDQVFSAVLRFCAVLSPQTVAAAAATTLDGDDDDGGAPKNNNKSKNNNMLLLRHHALVPISAEQARAAGIDLDQLEVVRQVFFVEDKKKKNKKSQDDDSNKMTMMRVNQDDSSNKNADDPFNPFSSSHEQQKKVQKSEKKTKKRVKQDAAAQEEKQIVKKKKMMVSKKKKPRRVNNDDADGEQQQQQRLLPILVHKFGAHVHRCVASRLGATISKIIHSRCTIPLWASSQSVMKGEAYHADKVLLAAAVSSPTQQHQQQPRSLAGTLLLMVAPSAMGEKKTKNKKTPQMMMSDDDGGDCHLQLALRATA